jgi:predicted MFS family arabinose efflux permease
VRVWHIWCLSFTVGLAQAFGGPAYSALVPSLVGKKDIGNAVALNSIQFNLARVLGPALGGIALAQLGAAWCFGLNGLSFIAVVCTLLMIRPQFVPAPNENSVLSSMKEGIQFIRVRDWMVSLVVLAFLIAALSFPMITFLPVVARDVLHGNANVYTLLLCLSGIGSVAGALITASLKPSNQARRSLTVMTVLGALIAAFGASHWVPLSGTLVLVAGGCLMVVFSTNLSVVQLYIEDTMRGRVMSVYNVAFRGGMPMGSLASGFLISRTSASVALIGNGVLVTLTAVYFLLFQRKLLKL